MGARFIDYSEVGEEYDVECVIYYEDTGKFKTDMGIDIDDFDIDNIGRDLIEEFVNSGAYEAYIRNDDLELDYELSRE